MKIRRIAGSLAALTAGALVLAACSSGSSTSPATTAGATTGIVTAWGSEPQNPLIPTNTNEVGGGKILNQIFAGLVYYDAKGKTHNEVADSITTTDAQTYTIKLKKGTKFTNGDEVKAKNFVDAWNFGATTQADVPQQLSNYFFSDIEGYDQTTVCADDACSAYAAPKSKELSGIKIVDDYTFTVKLSQPESDWPLRLGYTAFFPLPAAAFTDMKAFGENPIGNGPYKIADKGWTHNVDIKLTPNADYSGDRKAMNGGVDIKFYESLDAAYADLQAGNLDVLDSIPDSAYGSFETDLGSRAVNQPAAIFQSFTIPQNQAHFSGDEGKLRRAAISESIDRPTITKAIFSGTRTPASDFTSPVIDGWSKTLKGADVLTYNPTDAKKKWAAADAISPWSGKFTIAYNSDGGHQAWVDAVSNSIKNTLGIDAQGQPYAAFKDLRADVVSAKAGKASGLTGAFRTGWQADYPSLFNFLGPLYATGAGSNDGSYSNPKFDDLLKSGSSKTTIADANKDFQAAQEILLQDLPAIPLWYSNVTGGYSDKVGNVQFGWDSWPLLYEVTKA